MTKGAGLNPWKCLLETIFRYYLESRKIFLLFYRTIYYYTRYETRSRILKFERQQRLKKSLRKLPLLIILSRISLSSVCVPRHTGRIDCFVNGTLPIKEPSSTFSKFLGDPSHYGSRLIYRSTRWANKRVLLLSNSEITVVERISRKRCIPLSRILFVLGWMEPGEEGKGSE